MSDSYIIPRTEAKNRLFKSLERLHAQLHDLAERFGSPCVIDADPKTFTGDFETPAVPLAEGWKVMICTNGDDEESLQIVSLPKHLREIDIFITPTSTQDGTGFEIPYLKDEAQFWIAIGPARAYDKSTDKDLTPIEVEALLKDVVNIIAPALEESAAE